MNEMKTIRTIISSLTALLLAASCVNVEEQIDLTDFGAPDRISVSGVVTSDAPVLKLSATYELPSGSSVTDQRFLYGFDESLSDARTLIGEGSGGSFSAEAGVVGKYGQTVFFKASVANSSGQKMTSETLSVAVPGFESFVNVSDPASVEVTASAVTVGSSYNAAPGVVIVETGFCYGAEGTPTIDGDHVTGKGGAAFTAVIDGLSQAQTIVIVAYVKDADGNIAYSAPVEVVTEVIRVESVELDKSGLELVEGETASLVATVLPEDAYDPSVVWSSSDESVAKVEDGTVKAVKAGTAVITVTTVDGGLTATCDVTVIAKVSGVVLNETSLDLVEGETATLKATVKPDNATNPEVVWSSDDESVATVKDGVVTAVSAGKTTITVTTVDGGMTATCEVTVTAKVKGVTLDVSSIYLEVGQSQTLKATVKPDNASNKNVTWSSSDESVATVVDGTVTAVASGSAKVTVTTEDGGFTASCDVVVAVLVKSVSIVPSSIELTEGDTYTLKAEIVPSNATNRRVTWSSDNQSVATVSSNGGVVTAVKAGSAVIKVRTDDGGKTATCKVTVKAKEIPLRSVTITPTTLSLTVGDRYTMAAKFTPANATNQKVYWSVEDETVASINDKGIVVALAAGKTKVIVTSDDGNKSDTCELTVVGKGVPATSIDLKANVLTLYKSEYAVLTPVVKPADTTDTTLVWKSSNTNVVEMIGENITAVGAGTAKVTVSTLSGKTDTLKVIVRDSAPGEREFVDLGLSVKWATNNVEAADPRKPGGFFAWGETESKLVFDWSNYLWCRGTSDSMYKYNDNASYGHVDNIYTLEPEDDAATVNWGEGWRMATDAEWTELRGKCTWTWVNISGTRGYILTSKIEGYSDSQIFLPAAGYRTTGGRQGANGYGYYWSSSLRKDIGNDAWRVYFDKEGKYRTEYFRYAGYSIRPVTQ